MGTLQVIPAICNLADHITRNELAQGRIHGEPAYVSRLLVRVSDFCRALGITTVALSEELGKTDSNKTGCDAVLVFTRGTRARIALFEAKWPKLNRKSNYLERSPQGVTSRC